MRFTGALTSLAEQESWECPPIDERKISGKSSGKWQPAGERRDGYLRLFDDRYPI